ncbi:MAG: ribonuclease HI [Candidatus Paceibacterota bacterium]|jgi:ribonuclease HI
MSKIIIFTDGSSRNNPGPGGWGAVIAIKSDDVTVIELGGGEKHTTNNRMELMAAIGGVSNAPESDDITVLSDSAYVINGITNWIHGWKRNNWRTSAKKAVLNKDLWMKLDECVAGKNIKWKHVAGHAGIPGNERCDEIATSFADGEGIKLYKGPIGRYDLKNILG